MEILTQLLEALVSDGVLDNLESESILEGNQTRANKARCLFDTVKKKGNEACRKTLAHLWIIDPVLSSQLHRSTSSKTGEATYL